MLAFLIGRWVGTMIMAKVAPQKMLTCYALANVALCVVVIAFGGYVGLYAMLAISFFMSISGHLSKVHVAVTIGAVQTALITMPSSTTSLSSSTHWCGARSFLAG